MEPNALYLDSSGKETPPNTAPLPTKFGSNRSGGGTSLTLPQNLLMASSVGDKQERHTSFTTNSSVNSSAGSSLNYEATADDIMKEDDIMVVVEDGAGIQNSPPQVR